MIQQGELYWLNFPAPRGSMPAYRRPIVVIQSNKFNRTAINTTVVCAITSNLLRSQAPGNVLLNGGEGGLKQSSVVNVSQVATVNKSELTEKIGTLGSVTVRRIFEGLELLLEP